MFREAGAADFAGVMRLYEHLHPNDQHATTYLNVIPNLARGAVPYGVIENVVVDSERRGTGVGKAVMAGTLQAAWDAGCYKVMLATGSKRESTLAYYRSCGFQQGVKTGFVAHPPG